MPMATKCKHLVFQMTHFSYFFKKIPFQLKLKITGVDLMLVDLCDVWAVRVYC